MSADLSSVTGRIPQFRSAGTDFLVHLVEPYAIRFLGSWYDRLRFGYDLFVRVTQNREGRSERTRRRPGRDVHFGDPIYPRFLLANAHLSSNQTPRIVVTAANVSSDPDLTDAPMTIVYEQSDAGQQLGIDATIDLRVSSSTPLETDLTLAGQEFEVSDGLQGVGVDTFAATVAANATLRQQQDRSAEGRLEVSLTKMSLSGGFGPDSIGGFLDQVLRSEPALDATVEFSLSSTGVLTVSSGSTNLDERIAGAVRERTDDTMADFTRRVEQEVESLVSPYLAEVDAILAGVVDTELSVSDLLELTQDSEAAAAELEQAAADAAEAIRDEVEDAVREKIEDEVEDAVESIKDALPTLPRFP